MSISLRNRIRILQRDGYRCIYCGRTSKETRLHVDHIVPRSHGGSSDWSNLVTACQDCNLGKSAAPIGLPPGVTLTEPYGWRGQRPGLRRTYGRVSGRREPLQSGSLGWCVDACQACVRLVAGRYHEPVPTACYAVLPLSMKAAGRGFVMEYRCACDHEWVTTWEREFAFEHSTQSRTELEGRLPFHTPA